VKQAELGGTAGTPVESLLNCGIGLSGREQMAGLWGQERIVGTGEEIPTLGKLSAGFHEMSYTL
jgi:hypothetical protein